MSTTIVLARELPEASLLELQRYVEFLRFKARQRLPQQAQLARDCDELAASYGELAAELADEVWLPIENEALLRSPCLPSSDPGPGTACAMHGSPGSLGDVQSG
jgi:hypothetical protein